MRLKNFTLSMLLMVAPAVVSANDYYVSPAGSGSKDGSSAENAWGITEFAEKFNATNSANFVHGDNIYFAPGKYAAKATFYVKKGLNLIGAEGAERTIFHGDADGDGTPERDRLFNLQTDIVAGETEGCINVTNIDFEDLAIAQGGNDTKGAFYIDNCGPVVTISKCNFKNLINTGQGANAFFIKRSTVKVVDCTFTNNKTANRGAIARIQGESTEKGFVTFERCLIANNECTDATTHNSMIMIQHNTQLNVVNCTFANNTCAGNAASITNPTAPDAKHLRLLNVVNCTFANNTSKDGNEIVLNASSTANIVNSIVGGNITSGEKINVQGCITGKTYAEVFGTNELTNGVLAPIAKNSATVNVADVVAALDPAITPAVDVTVDQTGATRTANVMGAYDYDPTAAGVESVNGSSFDKLSNHGVKVLKDGRLVIEKGGKMFTVAGQQI